MIKVPFLKKPSRLERHFLALELGTDSIKAIVFEAEEKERGPVDFLKEGESKPLSVIGIGRHPQKPTDMYSGAVADINAVSEAASKALEEAAYSCGIKPKQVFLGLSGEAVKGFTTTVRLKREEPNKPLEEKELEFIAGQVKEAAFREISKEMTGISGNPNLELEMVFSDLAGVKVDGYRVGSPLGFRGKALEISLFSAVSPVVYAVNFRTILKNLKLQPRVTVPILYPLVKILEGAGRGEMNFILFDIGEERTDLALVFGGEFLSSRTVGLGGRAFSQILADSLDLEYNQAEKKKIRYGRGKLGKEESEKVKEALKPVLNLWCSSIEEALSDFSYIKSFPDRIIFVGGGAALPDLKTTFESFPWTRSLPFPSSPRGRLLEIGILDRFLVNKTGKVYLPTDILPLSLGYLYLELREVSNARAFFRT